MSNKTISLTDMIQQIRAWQRETNNFQVDPYSQDEFKDRLNELYESLAPIVNIIDSRSALKTPEEISESQSNEDT